jgi:butyryl-CoA dehydrogenase
MSYVLTEEQELIQQNACEFAAEYIEPEAVEIAQSGTYPAAIVKNLAENDFFGLFLPGEYGGAEAGYLSYILTVEEIAKVSPSVAAILINHASLAAYSINKWGSEAQKDSYLSALCSGDKIGAFAWSEPDHAPGVGPDRLVAVKQGDDYLLNGKKSYVANGGVAGTYVVFAQTDTEAGVKGISAFIVDGDSDGLNVTRTIGKMGLRGCPSAELTFADVKVPAANLLGSAGNGLAMYQDAKAAASVAEGALAAGCVASSIKEAANYAKQRVQFKRPISDFPAVQNLLADIATNLYVARLAIYDAAALIENGERFATEAAMIKLFVSRIGTKALIDAIQVEGGIGFCEDMAVTRFYRDVNGVFLSDSSVDFPEPVIAQEVLL